MRELGSTRHTNDVDYLINDNDAPLFSHEGDTDYINAAAHSFYREVSTLCEGGEATPQAMAEMKAFAWVQHLLNGYWAKADDAEFDLKFLKEKFGVTPKLVKQHVMPAQYQELMKIY